MYLKAKHHFTSTFDFRNDSLQFCEPFAHSLEWLYDEDNFEDERYWLYCMNGVMPIYILMSILKDIIIFAFDDYAEPNIKDYINRMETDNNKHGWNENEPFIKYEGEYLIIGQVHSFTTEVILWAAYLYFTFRTEINKENKKAERGRNVLYKLYRQKVSVKEEYLKETFLMKHFNQAMITILKNVPTSCSESKDEDRQKPQMEESVLGRISPNNIRYYYEGWRNGKHGSICQSNGIYRFVEMTRGKSGMLDDVKRNEEDNSIVAKGIVAYWLQFNSRMDTVIKRLTKYNCEIPKDIRELFDNYTQIRFEQFRQEHRDDPNTWDWDWDREFYANVIIPHEMAFNKLSEALFNYISDSDIELVRSVMNSYIKYLKKIRTEKGYLVNPELLVLRAIESGDDTKYEDLEEFEINTILDKLEEKRYIQVAWIEGHKPEAVRLLDKGRCYLKQLEEGSVVVRTTHIATPQQPFIEETEEMPYMHQTPKYSEQEENEEIEWDDEYDYIFDERVKPQEIKRAIEMVKSVKIKDRRFYYVAYRILKVIKWIPVEISESDYMRWINCHFKCGWEMNKTQKKAFLFNLEGSVKKLDDLHPSEWKDNSIYGILGKHYRLLAISFKNTFTVTIINGKPVADSESFEHLKDRAEFLSGARDYHGALWAPDEAYINDGK